MPEKQYIRDDPEEEMSLAIEQWLASRTSFHAGAEAGPKAYCHADRRLLAAFAADWAVDNQRLLAQAYQDF
jgi:hypothetical protein